ncbi:MAG: YrhK family protein [Actinomycetota bacterium]|nr:YrhK family protein [Actinomycetota bacterium]
MAIHWQSTQAPRRPTDRWIGVLFAIGSLCFVVGPLPGFVDLVGSVADGAIFFAGSLFFTAAALLQFLQSQGGDRAATAIQLVGTVFFNLSTFRGMQDSFESSDVNRFIWGPDALGSACFLLAGVLAYLTARRLRRQQRIEWRVAVVNLTGCILFGIAAIASFIVPETGTTLDLAAANWTTSLGALCFLVGALMLTPKHDAK